MPSLSLSRRHLLIAAALAPALAHAQRTPQELKDYAPVKPPQPTEGNKIEVLEFFQYTCPHCAALEPTLANWRKTLPSDVDYRRNPIAWNESTLPHVKIYYTLDALKKVEDMHGKVFKAIQADRRPLLKTDEIADFMAANGFDRKQWLDTFNSFAVGTRASRAGQVWRAYKVDGTPMIAIDGKYMTAPSMVGTREGTPAVMDYLIQKVRADRGAKK